MGAKLIAHRGQQPIGEVGLASGREPLIERRAQDRRWRRRLDRGLDRPSPLT
jgi:hypothetical protein